MPLVSFEQIQSLRKNESYQLRVVSIDLETLLDFLCQASLLALDARDC